MLISRVSDNVGEGVAGGAREGGAHSHEYQTANELFDLMTKNHEFEQVNEGDSLTAQDLVILYKNIDIGTKLMTSANELKHKKPNQYVETVVHDDDDSDGSDISEIYSFEDLHDVVMINKERIDMLTNHSSLENTLCHKLGDLEIQTSDLTTEYDRHFIFKDPYIKDQLKNFNLKYNAQEIGESLLPASLLDYICCKRLEDNYNFYMDNIIKYVKHTIDQLKRISNGDYLTDKAKEKWREVQHKVEEHIQNDTKVLATSTSIPLHVERKIGGHASTWDDLVHSEVDLRSLSKILEKKIIVEVPKLLCGSYTLFSKQFDDNLIISCKREKEVESEAKKGESRVDVVFQLQRSQSGQVISNINSIMILKTAPAEQLGISASKILPLPYKKSIETMKEKKIEIIELVPDSKPVHPNEYEAATHQPRPTSDTDQEQPSVDTATDISDYPCSENDCSVLSESGSNPELNGSAQTLRDILDRKGQFVHADASFNILSPDELRIRMQRLSTQSTLLEESEDTENTATKKKSPTRVRIKSPYENQSMIMEEKKRKKLLEIREKREKKKIALSETCKVSKHKYGKGVIMPQPSSSVTKLSITNKSFYNSIYGQSMNIDNKQKRKGLKKESVPDTGLELDDDETGTSMLTPDKNSKKFTNRSYYLDDAVTEMMYLDMKQKDNKDTKESSACTSVVSTDFPANLTMLTQLIGPSSTDISKNLNSFTPGSDKSDGFQQMTSNVIIKQSGARELTSSQSIINVPMNSPKNAHLEENIDEPKKSSSSVECRKSIDKIYGLMKNIGRNDDATENILFTNKFTAVSTHRPDANYTQGHSTVQGTDSGTSLKHHLTSSNPSCFSFEKPITSEVPIGNKSAGKNSDVPGTVIPKVIISSKLNNMSKPEPDKNKKERRKSIISPIKITENPLKAISQLLHEFENVQKNRQKPNDNLKSPKKDALSNDLRNGIIRQNVNKRRSRLNQHLKEHPPIDKAPKPIPRDKKTKQGLVIDAPKIPHQQISVEEKPDRFAKKKITDILDEAKEARGEAVRGPSKLNRLNSLAQPKRSYVQAHSEEFQTRYGRNVMADRLQRMAAAPAAPVERPTISANLRNKQKRSNPEPSPTTARQPLSSMSPLDRMPRSRRASSTSPSKPTISQATIPSHKHTNIVESSPTDTLKKNMVESYVKSHYGREPSGITSGILQQSVPKARVPLFPTDLDLISTSSSPILEESTELGSKLHFIINTIINKEPSLTVLTECQEINSKHSRESINMEINEVLNCPDNSSSSSAAHVDILEDENVITAVENHRQQCCKLEAEIIGNIPEQGTSANNEVLPYSSTTEIEKLENALYRKISVGTFQSRLRIKKLTLTPKQSMQQVFLLQSGDAGSMLLKSSISQIKIKENLTDLNVFPALSNTHMSWHFSNLPRNTSIPVQITTVGYAFPQYDSAPRESESKANSLLDAKSEDVSFLNNKMDKVSQCFKGEHADVRSDHGIQADINKSLIENCETTESVSKADDITISSINYKPEDFIETNEQIKELKKDNKTESSDSQFTQTNEIEIHEDQKRESIIVNDKSEAVLSYTSSLDVLVGLLNEIQKITTCQTHITQTNDQDCKELEYILKDAAVLEQKVDKDKTPDLVSMSSLDKLRQLESTPSIYSFYLSNDGDRDLLYHKSNRVNNGNDVMSVKEPPHMKPIYADKEVSVECIDREIMNRCTEAPSQFFPITVNHSTNVTNSLLGALSESSSNSTMYSLAELCDTMYVNNNLDVYEKIKELPQESYEDTSCLIVIPEIKSYVKQICDNTVSDICTEPNVNPRKIVRWNKKNCKSNLVVRGSEFDPAIKVKRDILVTLYSILVFTVFAALSFPEMLYY